MQRFKREKRPPYRRHMEACQMSMIKVADGNANGSYCEFRKKEISVLEEISEAVQKLDASGRAKTLNFIARLALKSNKKTKCRLWSR